MFASGILKSPFSRFTNLSGLGEVCNDMGGVLSDASGLLLSLILHIKTIQVKS